MKFSVAIKKRINYYLKLNDMSIWKLYKASGVPKSTLFALMKDDTVMPKLETLLYIYVKVLILQLKNSLMTKYLMI